MNGWKPTFVPEVYCVVCHTTRCDQEFRIENPLFAVLKILRSNWIHVMDENINMNLSVQNAQIATIVSRYDDISNLSPLARGVKLLIDPSIETECAISDYTSEREVIEALLERTESTKFRIRPNLRHSRLRFHRDGLDRASSHREPLRRVPQYA